MSCDTIIVVTPAVETVSVNTDPDNVVVQLEEGPQGPPGVDGEAGAGGVSIGLACGLAIALG